MTKIRVLIADDHAILREGLRALLSYYEDVAVVGEVQDGEEALQRVGELQPDVVLMDVAMPGMGGIEATRLIQQRYPKTRVLVLSQHEDWRYVQPLLKAGASGYITKRAIGADLITALRVVVKGEIFLHPSIASTVVDQIRRKDAPTPEAVEALTPREREILASIARGQTNAQIAADLSISVKTVEWHRTNLMSKLDVHSVADLVRFALQHNLVDQAPVE